ncbi:integrative and conjugative element protein (TIGR02256 family) [Paraburkholderia sp. BL6665CI2N2]|uniref:Mov34/MPN/PAD-1 family protein n=1 Tax=Paraburkholderia sp. BL6665CI2N2 TaxID=1938806 RepID=UPI001066F698|nr:Mov34/MPN/PAD-1 family protein [Paraburkholderia sp. BL6665CI2N2]TDY21969.1 integrative and conjugative element protein (TIGR02256 family) [Paraburkholderia sp. BL6665CI2N2]
MPDEFVTENSLLGAGKVLVEQQVWETIIPFRQAHSAATEAGGILLGYRRGAHLHVVDATFPQPGDRRSRFRFTRAKQSHQHIALQRWKETSGTVDYLGEWHTHPESMPSPSSLDTAEWRKIYEPRAVPMLFVILGWSSHVWVGVGCGSRLEGTNCSPPAVARTNACDR